MIAGQSLLFYGGVLMVMVLYPAPCTPTSPPFKPNGSKAIVARAEGHQENNAYSLIFEKAFKTNHSKSHPMQKIALKRKRGMVTEAFLTTAA